MFASYLETNNTHIRCVCDAGIPALAYGLAATRLITHSETVHLPSGPVQIYFLYAENKGSQY